MILIAVRQVNTLLAFLPARLSVCPSVRPSDCQSVLESFCSAKLVERLNHKKQNKYTTRSQVGHSIGTKVKALAILSLAYYTDKPTLKETLAIDHEIKY